MSYPKFVGEDPETEEGPDGYHWDPSPAERTYYRREKDGQLGWLVRREGKDCIKLDRGAQEIIEKLDARWAREESHKPLTIGHVGQICFEADRALCRFIGMHEQSRRQWADLDDNTKIAWMKKGPTKDPIRREVYAAVREVLGRYSQ